MKKTATVLLLIIATLSFIQVEKATADQPSNPNIKSIWIKEDGNIEPSSAPIQHTGNVYSLTSDITNCNFTIQRNNIVLNGAGFSLKGPGEEISDLAAVSLICTNVTVFNLTISGWHIGVLGIYDGNIIQSNKFTRNYRDIEVYADNYLITGNQIGPQRLKGNNITVTKNQISVGDYQTGFWISNCTNLKLKQTTSHLPN